MKTDYAMVVRCFSDYSHIFHKTYFYIRLYNSKRQYFTVCDPAENIYDSCLPGDMVEYTEEKSPKIVKNLNHEKRLSDFNVKYQQLQKQR